MRRTFFLLFARSLWGGTIPALVISYAGPVTAQCLVGSCGRLDATGSLPLEAGRHQVRIIPNVITPCGPQVADQGEARLTCIWPSYSINTRKKGQLPPTEEVKSK